MPKKTNGLKEYVVTLGGRGGYEYVAWADSEEELAVELQKGFHPDDSVILSIKECPFTFPSFYREKKDA